MFTDEAYEYYNKCVDRALIGDVAPYTSSSEDQDPVCYWDNDDDSTFETFTNVTIYHYKDKVEFCIDIFTDYIEFDYCGNYGMQSFELSTKLFHTESDEEFFQVGTVIDLYFMEETLLRKFIKLSLMAREHELNKESK